MTPSVTLLGTGKMGAAFVDRWRQAGREVVVWNRNPASAHALAGAGVKVEETARGAARNPKRARQCLAAGASESGIGQERPRGRGAGQHWSADKGRAGNPGSAAIFQICIARPDQESARDDSY